MTKYSVRHQSGIKHTNTLSDGKVALGVAGASSIFAFIALHEQRRMREASTDPVVIAHFGQREDARELVTFKLTNVGAGAATNVQLDVTPPDVDFSKLDLMSNIFVRHHPFRVIPQGQSIEFSLSLGFKLLGDIPLPPFKVRLDYENIEEKKYWTELTLDVREMEMLGSEASLRSRATKSLESIAEGLASSQNGTKPIRTLTQTVVEKRQEHADAIAKIKARREK